MKLIADWSATDATFKATAPVAGSLGGGRYVVRLCLSTHTLGAPPSASCQDRTVGSGTATLTRTLPRPPAGGTAWATGIALLGRQPQAGGAIEWVAHSWPAAGVADASIVIPDVDGVVPGPAPNQGVLTAPGAWTGGPNTSQRDSMCVEEPAPGSAPAEPTLSTTVFGQLPWYYEVGEPTGAFAGQPPKGIMLVVHGGGFVTTGSGAVIYMRADAERWRARGWRTVNTTYRGCAQSLADALTMYDTVRAAYGTSLPVCGVGASAGGAYVLYLAARRDLYCVISQAGPADFLALKDQTAYDAATGGQQTVGPKSAYNLVTAAFGEENLATFSPQQLGIHGRVLFAIAEADPLIPPSQAGELRDAVLAADPAQYADAFVLPVGEGAFFIHGPTSAAAIEDYFAHEEALVAPLG
jgi:hypothetical protein